MLLGVQVLNRQLGVRLYAKREGDTLAGTPIRRPRHPVGDWSVASSRAAARAENSEREVLKARGFLDRPVHMMRAGSASTPSGVFLEESQQYTRPVKP